VQKTIKRLIAIIAWIIIWQILAMIIHNKILLAGPIETLQTLIRLSGDSLFWQSVAATTGRILLGFLIGSILGIILGYVAHIQEIAEIFLKPLVLAMKSVPVASFVILLLIWFGNRNISLIIVAMVVFPILYTNTLEGLKSTDSKFLEMAKVFRMPKDRVIRYIFLPQLLPFWQGAFKLAIGMSFKSGIAAEVIGQPLGTIGNGLYQAKIYLETGELFAWTIVTVLIAFICERLITFMLMLPMQLKSK
jgi:NitT/TauT family transport system permease protein